jgi:hypothetical protein
MTEHLVAHYLKISSLDKLSNQTSSNFTINDPQFDDVHSFRVEEIVLPVSWYPINSTNNQFIFNPNAGGNVTATITPGVYTTITFIAELQTQMNAVSGGPTYVATISSATGKITITQNAGTYTVDRTSSSKYILGLNSSLGTSSAAISFVSDYVINLSGTNVVVLKSRELTKYGGKVYTGNQGSSSIVCRIPVLSSFGSTIEFRPYNKYLTYNGERSSAIDIQLYDQWDNILDMNGGDWFMSLKFHSHHLHNQQIRKQIHTMTDDNKTLFQVLTLSNKN